MASPEDKPRGFSVNDRRQVGTADADAPTAQAREAGGAAAASAPDAPPAAAPPAGTPDQARARAEAMPLPPVELHTFLLSLASSALVHLGEIESPEGERPRRNLPMAKHTIDVLAMLQAKTKGNLTAAEEQLLESLLFDLRLRYVEAVKRG
jgi:hypothetical protein